MRRCVLLIATIWILSIAAAVTWAQSSGGAQPPRVVVAGQAYGDVISGENIGFQPAVDPRAPWSQPAG